eukprot:gene547-23486_t
MGKQAKARRKREGWGCTNKRFQPITIRNEPQQSDSDSDGEGWSKLKAKQTTVKGSGSNALCGKKKRKSEAEQKDIDLFLGVKRGGKKRKAGQLLPGRGHPAKGGGSKAAAGGGGGGEAALLPKIEWADKKIAPFKRVFWADGAGAAAPATPAEEEVLKSSRKKIGVVVKGGNAPAPVAELDDERYPESFTSVFEYTRRITEPTPVQQQCWPAILAGSNVLGLAETGSGKTLSYLLPAVPHVLARGRPKPGPNPVCLILVPTRELAAQVESMCRPIIKAHGLRCVALYGGIQKMDQIERMLSPTPFVVATPGRLVDMVGSNDVSLASVTYLVLDEADRMLMLGFKDQIDAICSNIRPDRQIMLFSATFPGPLQEAVAEWVGPDQGLLTVRARRDRIEGAEQQDDGAESEHAVAAGITQMVHVCATHKKPKKLIRLITKLRTDEKERGIRSAGQMIVFCNKIKTVAFVVDTLRKQRVQVGMFHGQLQQNERESVLANFRGGQISVLIATDIAGRGLDIKGLTYVVNYDFPTNLGQYVHRIGRAGRSGAEGHTFSFFTRNLAPMAGPLVKLLKQAKQTVDPNLAALVEEGEASAAIAATAATESEQESDNEGSASSKAGNPLSLAS